jgi:clan AA aspartic protease (TIGR02281 family)
MNAAAADQQSPQDTLKSKGLIRVGALYVLDGDAHLTDMLRPMRMARRDLAVAQKDRAAVQDEIRSDENQMAAWQSQRDDLEAELGRTSQNAVAKYNQLVGDANAVNSKLQRGQVLIDRRKQDLASMKIPDDEYFDAAAKFLTSFGNTVSQYDKLAADTEVTAALKQINAGTKIQMRLGPSIAFKNEMPEFQKMKAEASDGTVKLIFEGGVPTVKATLNGTEKVDMVVDSGAAIVTLSADVAKKLDIKLSKSDPIMHLITASGEKVDAHLVTLESIKVGPFIAEHVQCAVQPASSKEAGCLLGGTFLQHFAYRMDLAGGELKLSQLSSKPADK